MIAIRHNMNALIILYRDNILIEFRFVRRVLAFRALLDHGPHVSTDIRFRQPVTLPHRMFGADQRIGIRHPKAPFRQQPLTSHDVRVLDLNRLPPALLPAPCSRLTP
jgi:hypothetical protein